MLLLVTMWRLGATYDLAVGSGLQPDSVIARPLEPSAVAQLRKSAEDFERRADSVEARALHLALDGGALEGERKRAGLYREWARTLEDRASAQDAALATREARRILWVYSIGLDLLVCTITGLLALAVSLRVLGGMRRDGRVTPRFAAGVLAATAMLAVAAYFVFVTWWYDYGSDPFLLVRAAVEPGVLAVVRFDDGFHVAVTTFGMALVFLLIAAPRLALARVWDDGASGPSSIAAAAGEIAESMRLTRFVLYVVAALLVVYVIAMSALFHWMMAFVDPGRQALFAGVEALTRSAVTGRSLLASGLVVAFSAPLVVMLRVMAGDLAARALPDATMPEREEWMRKHGMAGANAFDNLKLLAAILAPVVTGPLADLLQNALG